MDLKEVSKYTAPEAVLVSKLTRVCVRLGVASGSQPVRAVIYADAGGDPGALLGVSNEVSIQAGQAWGWVDFTFPSAVSVAAGTVWMGYIAGSKSDLTQLRYDSSSNELHYNSNSGGYAAGPSNPFGKVVLSNMHYSLYATYTVAGGALRLLRLPSASRPTASAASAPPPPPPPPAGAGTANLWVNTSAGSSPGRCATPCAYNATKAYGSLNAAYAAAQGGDVIYVRAGSYGDQSIAPRSLGTQRGHFCEGPERRTAVTLASLGSRASYVVFDGFTDHLRDQRGCD